MAPFGEMIPVTVVERLLLDQLKLYLPAWLGAAERATDRDKNTLPDVRGWGVPRGWFDKQAADQTPFVAITSPGMNAPPKLDGEREYRAWWAMEATVVVSARDFDASDKLAKTYGAAIAGCVVNQLPGDPVEQITWDRDEYVPVGKDENSLLVSATNFFTVTVGGVLQRGVGIDAVPDDPREAPEDWPVVETVELTVEHQD
jgi:hypothetical protein